MYSLLFRDYCAGSYVDNQYSLMSVVLCLSVKCLILYHVALFIIVLALMFIHVHYAFHLGMLTCHVMQKTNQVDPRCRKARPTPNSDADGRT
jgi:hypothetical protein